MVFKNRSKIHGECNQNYALVTRTGQEDLNLSLTLFVYASNPICTQSITYLLVTLTCWIQNLERNGHMTFATLVSHIQHQDRNSERTKGRFFFISVRVSEGKSTLRKLSSWAPSICTRYQWKYPTVCTTFKRRMWLKTVSCREAVVSCYILFMACFLVQFYFLTSYSCFLIKMQSASYYTSSPFDDCRKKRLCSSEGCGFLRESLAGSVYVYAHTAYELFQSCIKASLHVSSAVSGTLLQLFGSVLHQLH